MVFYQFGLTVCLELFVFSFVRLSIVVFFAIVLFVRERTNNNESRVFMSKKNRGSKGNARAAKNARRAARRAQNLGGAVKGDSGSITIGVHGQADSVVLKPSAFPRGFGEVRDGIVSPVPGVSLTFLAGLAAVCSNEEFFTAALRLYPNGPASSGFARAHVLRADGEDLPVNVPDDALVRFDAVGEAKSFAWFELSDDELCEFDRLCFAVIGVPAIPSAKVVDVLQSLIAC
ncbi:hypothetical protein O4158_21430 [Gordonia amicalis]|uniref:hypothetical protein n=1 Tax=Gordonia amicalis TaxID=89053 RepID=UPI0022B4C636|nr:hypothetical protein [Gordonia amicalis]MCZ4581604.1 hypothetical protein [Gordonia amicalis]